VATAEEDRLNFRQQRTGSLRQREIAGQTPFMSTRPRAVSVAGPRAACLNPPPRSCGGSFGSLPSSSFATLTTCIRGNRPKGVSKKPADAASLIMGAVGSRSVIITASGAFSRSMTPRNSPTALRCTVSPPFNGDNSGLGLLTVRLAVVVAINASVGSLLLSAVGHRID
jgi:hypothetical protein